MRGRVRLRLRAAFAGCAALGLAGAALTAFPAISSASAGSEYVSPTGNDVGSCSKRAPCKTINYAIAQATPGETIHVERGRYHQTVDVNKSVAIIGAGSSSTILSGAGLDPTNDGYYGVVYVGNANGNVTVSGLTITNPYPYAYTGGEPMAVALADPNASDTIDIANDNITEGKADRNASTDFPIGIDSFVNAATTQISGNSISGFFQGALLEDNGPATVSDNTFSSLISNTDNSTSPPTVYPAEGVFFLADDGATHRHQDASGNSFSHYSGYGIAESAGYTGGYVTPGCVANGSISTDLAKNSFALTGNSKAAAISLEANGTGNHLAGSVTGNRGYVTSPSKAIVVQARAVPATPPGTNCGSYGTSNGGGGTLAVTMQGNDITVKSAARAATATVERRNGLHMPNRPRRTR